MKLSPSRPADGVTTDALESKTHSFIIKLWLEETAEETGQATWRGHITHVPSGQRRYLRNFNGIIAFILPYLQQMGVKFTWRWRVEQSFHLWKLYFKTKY